MALKVPGLDTKLQLPKSKPLRIGLGLVLVGGGLLGFLPVLGFWMIPLGLLVLSVDLPIVRRWRRQLTVWWHDSKARRAARRNESARPSGHKDTGAGAGT